GARAGRGAGAAALGGHVRAVHGRAPGDAVVGRLQPDLGAGAAGAESEDQAAREVAVIAALARGSGVALVDPGARRAAVAEPLRQAAAAGAQADPQVEHARARV